MRRNTPENRCGPAKLQQNGGISTPASRPNYACRPAVIGPKGRSAENGPESSQISVAGASPPQVSLKFPIKAGGKLPLVYTNDPLLRQEFGLSGLMCKLAIEAGGQPLGKWSELQGERSTEAVDSC